MAIALKKQVIAIGVSANKELHSQKYIDDLGTIIEGAKYFSLRDSNSLETLKKAGIKTNKLKVVDDLALANEYARAKRASKHNGVLGLVLIHNDNEAKLVDFVNKTIDYCEKGKKYNTIKLISFFNQYEHDLKALRRIADNCRKSETVKLEILNTKLNADGISEALSSCDLILSMRYHATLIASFALGVKTVCVDYGDTHAHYYNKNKSIRDSYVSNLALLNFSEMNNSSKLSAAIRAAEKQELAVDEKRLRDIRSRLRDIINTELS